MKEEVQTEIDKPEFERGISKESTQSIPDLIVFELDRRFYILYFTIPLFILANSIGFYNSYGETEEVLVIGLAFSIAIAIFSLIFMMIEQHGSLNKEYTIIVYACMYFITGLIIIVTDPEVILFFENSSKKYVNSSFFLLFLLTLLGSKYFIKTRTLYYILSYVILVIAFVLGIHRNEIMYHHVITFCLLIVYIYFNSFEIKSAKEMYQVLVTEEASAIKVIQPNTPLEEILTEIHNGIDKIASVSKNTPATVQRIHRRIVRLLQSIAAKMQSADNLYMPRLELVTKNMDADDKIYIEQECFDNQRIPDKNPDIGIIERKVVEYGISELAGFLKGIGKEWNFNSFFVAGCCKTPATVIGKYAIKMYGLDEIFSISDSVLELFLNDIEKRYPDNPYHNSTHAADVMSSFAYFLTNSRLSDSMTSIEWLAGLVACLGHDVGHPGKNNRFLVMINHEIAITYNDISVLEMMHASIVFKVLSNNTMNIFASLQADKFIQVRKLIIDMILATDLSKHFDILSYMRTKYNETSDFSIREIRGDLLRLCLKSADVGHAAKSIELHERWCLLIIEEFFTQGDLEKQKGLAVSMYCDRETTNIPKSQVGFIRNIVFSLFTTLNSILASDEIEKACLNQLKQNERYWESLAKQRNLSTVQKVSEIKNDSNIFPLLKRKTIRKGSLPPLCSRKVTKELNMND